MDILKKFKRGKKSNEGTETYQALYMYKATRAGDLSFDEGDQLEILTEETDGWWMASNPRTGTRGYVPSNFIRKLSSVMNNNTPASKFYTTATTITTNTTPTTITTPTTSTSPTIKADKYIALYDYVAVDSESISLKKGEVMEVVFQPDNHWSYVKVLRGSSVVNEGYIPTSYITKLGENVNQPWYFGNMTRQEAHAYLMNTFNSNGSFLVRNSESTTGYSLSVLFCGTVKHYKVNQDTHCANEICFISSDICFSSLKSLVEHYQHNDGLCTRLSQSGKVGRLSCLPASPDHLCNTFPQSGAEEAPPEERTTREVRDVGTSNPWEIQRNSIQLVKKLGSGQYGDVCQGRWNNQMDVAVKTMKPECMELEEFMREAEVMQKLRHPRLVKLYGLCTTPRDRPILIVVELVKNGALLQHLRKRKYEKQLHPVGDLVKIGLQVASGMAYLEAQKFIHRDLAARNVLIGEGISVKIADFGLARVIKDDVYHHNSNNKIPFKWTAPEAISFGQFTSKSDVWSYGILLFEIVTHGQMPYEGMDNQTAVKKIQQSYRLPQPASCPWELYNIMFRCWMENPEARPRFVDLKEEMSRLTTIF